MFSLDEYKYLVSKYGPYASWAIWNNDDHSDSSIIAKNIPQLHSRFVLLGLNISGPLENTPWLNFHKGPSNVRKIKFVCENTSLWGSYITDLFKGIPEKDSSKLKSMLTEEMIMENVDRFDEEMRDIKMSSDTIFIVFGNTAAFYFNNYFRRDYKNSAIYHYHYSHYGVSDKTWVESLWKKLNINQKFEPIKQ